jgi:hypothetical protein
MSYRIVEGTSDVCRVVVMGSRSIAGLAAPPIGDMLKTDAAVLDGLPAVRTAVTDRMSGVWPLAGLLLEPSLGGEMVNLAAPRRPVDKRARTRRWALLGAGGLAVIALGVWTFGGREMSDLDAELSGLTDRMAELRPRVTQYQRDAATLVHLQRWETVDVRWLDHLLAMERLVPPPVEAVLDGWTGSLEFRGVAYDRKSKRWSAPCNISFVLDGEARDRMTADALRAALVRSRSYRASSTGTDAPGGKRLPFGFTYRLTTSETAPEDLDQAAATSRGAGGRGGEG